MNKFTPTHFLALDLETTSTDMNTCEVMEIGFVPFSLIAPGEVKIEEQFNRHFFFPVSSIEASTAEFHLKNGYLETYFKGLYSNPGVDLWDLLEDCSESVLCSTRVVAGKNIQGFDLPILRRFISREDCHDISTRRKERLTHNYGIYSHRALDIGSMLWEPGMRGVPNLEECYELSEIDHKPVHSGLQDCLDVIEIVRKYSINRWK